MPACCLVEACGIHQHAAAFYWIMKVQIFSWPPHLIQRLSAYQRRRRSIKNASRLCKQVSGFIWSCDVLETWHEDATNSLHRTIVKGIESIRLIASSPLVAFSKRYLFDCLYTLVCCQGVNSFCWLFLLKRKHDHIKSRDKVSCNVLAWSCTNYYVASFVWSQTAHYGSIVAYAESFHLIQKMPACCLVVACGLRQLVAVFLLNLEGADTLLTSTCNTWTYRVSAT